MVNGLRWLSDTCYAFFVAFAYYPVLLKLSRYLNFLHSFHITLLSTWGCVFAADEWHLVLPCAISIAWEVCYKSLLIEVGQKQHSFKEGACTNSPYVYMWSCVLCTSGIYFFQCHSCICHGACSLRIIVRKCFCTTTAEVAFLLL